MRDLQAPPFLFATGIENSYPTLPGGARADQMERCGHDALGLCELAGRYYRRYGIPLFHCETNRVRRLAVEWLRLQWRDVLQLRASGIPVRGFTWCSLTDQTDWQHGLRVVRNEIYPVGLFDIDRQIRPVGKASRARVAVDDPRHQYGCRRRLTSNESCIWTWEDTMSDHNVTDREWARRRVEAVRGFNVHASIYLVVNLILITIDMVTPGDVWFYWPLIGWGIWVAAHGVAVWGEGRLWGKAWEERKIEDLLAHKR